LITVDTSVLSLAFRRPRRAGGAAHPAVVRLREAIESGAPVVVPGICTQELLTGVRTTEQFDRLVDLLAPFPVLLASRAHHLAASRVANACRAAGVAAGAVDALIAALTIESHARLLTADADFARVATVCPLALEPYAPA
jgi:hypothetical protein